MIISNYFFIKISFFCCLPLFINTICLGQEKVFPIIPDYGGIYPIENEDPIPDLTMRYDIVIDFISFPENPEEMAYSFNNVARLLNLYGAAGLQAKQINVVLAVHGPATYALLDDKTYTSKYGYFNPNRNLLKALQEAGVRITVCGQSLIGRGIDPAQLIEDIEVATSMLTTVTTYQLKGYSFLQF